MTLATTSEVIVLLYWPPLSRVRHKQILLILLTSKETGNFRNGSVDLFSPFCSHLTAQIKNLEANGIQGIWGIVVLKAMSGNCLEDYSTQDVLHLINSDWNQEKKPKWSIDCIGAPGQELSWQKQCSFPASSSFPKVFSSSAASRFMCLKLEGAEIQII